MLPDLIGDRFQPRSILGEGGFGITYQADDLEGDGPVAIKVLRMDRVDDWKAVELFQREGRTLQGLDHGRIPNYVDCHFDPESAHAYLAQELAPGKSIGQRLSDGERFDEDRALDIAEQVLEVLQYLSGLSPQVIHRDIKPDNLLLDDDGSIYLVDFGAVREVARQAGDGSTVAGTFGYMAPEQLRGHAAPASDIYGLAMTLIHMLSGTPPERMAQERMTPKFRQYTNISEGLAELLDDMSQPMLDDRIASADDCLRCIETLRDPFITAPSQIPDSAPGGASLRERLEAEEARKEAQEKERLRQQAEEKRRAKEALARHHESIEAALTIEKHSPIHWSMTFDPDRRRRIDIFGRSLFGLLTLGYLLCFVIGVPMVALPILWEAHVALIINLGFWGLFSIVCGIVLVVIQIKAVGGGPTRLVLEDGAFELSAPDLKEPQLGRASKLQADIRPPEQSRSYGVLYLDWKDDSISVEGFTLDEIKLLRTFFKEADISLWD